MLEDNVARPCEDVRAGASHRLSLVKAAASEEGLFLGQLESRLKKVNQLVRFLTQGKAGHQ